MTGREQTLAAIAHESDRVPMLVTLTRACAEKYGQDLIKRYAGERERRYIQREGLEMREVMEVALGNHAIRVRVPWWAWIPDERSRAEDGLYFSQRVRGMGSYEDYFEKALRLRDELSCYVLVMIYGSHFEKAQSSRGFENFLADMAAEPEAAKALLQRIMDKNMVMLENALEAEGVDGILLGSDWGSQRGLLIGRHMWMDMIYEGEKREYDVIREAGKQVWIHSCGDIWELLPDLCGMGVSVLNPLQPECMNIGDIKRVYGERLCFWGGISTQRTLPYGTPQQVAEETRAVIELLSAGGGYISSPAQDIQDDVPYENIVALLDTVRSFT